MDKNEPTFQESPNPGVENSLQTTYCSHLFTMRIWSEPIGSGKSEWRGRVQHISSGETAYFRHWENLIRYIDDQLSQPDDNPGKPCDT